MVNVCALSDVFSAEVDFLSLGFYLPYNIHRRGCYLETVTSFVFKSMEENDMLVGGGIYEHALSGIPIIPTS